MEHNRSGGIQLANPVRQRGERNVDRSRKVAATPLVGSANVDYLDVLVARGAPELAASS